MELIEGSNFTKDLVSEPGNVLHPDEYAQRLKRLSRFGLKVTVYDQKKLKKMGMNALLGVGQGSIRGSYLVTMEWKGIKSKKKPLAFVGKGVCFDTGGISLKPAKFMEDMTYDMAGSLVVVGLMKNLALRKARVNAIGVVGLVENMPGGNAQRPGDIVKSYSGKTIEVLNTDAEGRLVLADALTFTEKFNPKFIVDLATLTGAIIVSLGSEYAGLFSNDDKLSKQIFESGKKVDEKVWRMPLHKNYDKLMNSKNADMQNINYVGGAGSTTAAQFLQRFILNKTPWAHLDIAGITFSKYGGALNSGGATGFGVRLLNQLIEDNYVNNLEQTLSIIKPDAVERNLENQIKEIFKNKGFKIIKEKKLKLEKSEAEQFYKVHETKPFYNDLCEYLSSGTVVVMILEKENAIKSNRDLMGATDPNKAEDGTIRKLFGQSIDKNSVHGSDSDENAKIEIDFFFKN